MDDQRLLTDIQALVHSRSPIPLEFRVELPSVGATGGGGSGDAVKVVIGLRHSLRVLRLLRSRCPGSLLNSASRKATWPRRFIMTRQRQRLAPSGRVLDFRHVDVTSSVTPQSQSHSADRYGTINAIVDRSKVPTPLRTARGGQMGWHSPCAQAPASQTRHL